MLRAAAGPDPGGRRRRCRRRCPLLGRRHGNRPGGLADHHQAALARRATNRRTPRASQPSASPTTGSRGGWRASAPAAARRAWRPCAPTGRTPRAPATTRRPRANTCLTLLKKSLGHVPLLPAVVGPAGHRREDPGRAPSSAAGAGDNAAAALGVGAGVGDVVLSLGTSGTVFAVSATPAADASGLVAGFADATGQLPAAGLHAQRHPGFRRHGRAAGCQP